MSETGRRWAVALLVAWVWAAATAARAESPIRIGASMAQTGSLATPGQTMLRGYRLRVRHANDKGGVLGRRIELVVEDDRSTGATAAALYEKLIVQDKVDAILGPYSSPITEAMADVAERHLMPVVAAGGAATSIFTKGPTFVFGLHSPADAYLRGLIEVAAGRGLETVAVPGLP